MLPTLDIVIVNWNTGPHLAACLRAVARTDRRGFALARVVVVDNDSSDASWDVASIAGLPVAVVRNVENRGYARACNQGAAGSRSDYLLLLNPDTEVSESCLSVAVAFMEGTGNRDVGVCGAALVDEDGRPGILGGRFPGPFTFVVDAVGLSRLWPTRFPGLLVRSAALPDAQPIDAVMGAFFLTRTAIFRQAGAFDERFFLYLEDVDLSLRVRDLGYRSLVLGRVRVRHAGGWSSRRVPATRLFYALRSRLQYALKHFTWLGAATVVATTFLELAPRLARSAMRRSPADAGATLTAYRLLARELPRLLSRGTPRTPAATGTR